MIAIDFETALIAPGLQLPPPVCLSWAGDGSGVVKDARPVFEKYLQGEIVGANIAFDMGVAAAAWPDLIPAIFRAYDEDRITDVSVRQKLIDIALGEYRQHGGYSLAALAKRLCDIELIKDDTRTTFWDLRDLPLEEWPKEYLKYSENDALATLAVYEAQEEGLKEVSREVVLEDQYRQCRADFALKLCSAWGLRTDAEGVARLRKACEDRQAEIRDVLLSEGLLKETKKGISRSVRAAQERMLSVNPKAKLTAKGQELHLREARYISVDEEACSDSGDPILEAYSEYSKLGSLLSGHVKAMEEGIEFPIHSHFEVLLDTGRTSSSKPNVQNIRRLEGARECFKPRDGFVYVACDYSAAELHTLAQCCKNLFKRSCLGDALNAGQDPHAMFGAKLAGISYEDLKERIKAGDKEAKAWRQRAKAFNFGAPGGMGPNGLIKYAKSSYGVILSTEQAQAYYDEWKAQWPVIQEYLQWIKDLTSATGFTTIEHFGSGRWRGHVPFCAAANSFFQGMAADGAKAALYAVTRECLEGSLIGCHVVNFIHDEILIEAPEDLANDAAWQLSKIMVEEFNIFTPDVPVRAEPVIMDRWSKSAEQIIENGVLKVWRYSNGNKN